MNDRRKASAVERWARAHRDEMVRDLMAFINIPSVACYDDAVAPMGTGCKQALDYFQSLAQHYGLATENDHDHSVSILMPGKTGDHELGILGHLDVVPAGEGWKYKPFASIQKNGYVIGRGAADNKGPLLMALYTLRSMRELGISLNNDVRLIAGCDEEKEMCDVRHYLKTHVPPVFTLNCDGAWPLCIGEKGILTADLTMPLESGCLLDAGGGSASNMVPASAWVVLRGVSAEALKEACSCTSGLSLENDDDHIVLHAYGKAAHCSTPGSGENAIRRLLQFLCASKLLNSHDTHKLSKLLQAIKDDNGTGLRINYADKISGSTSCVASLLSLRNNVLRLHINVRSAVTHPAELLIRRLHESSVSLGLNIQNLTFSPPRLDSLDQPVLKLLLATCHEFASKRYQPYVAGGGTHSRIFPHSTPFGPLPPVSSRRNAFGGPHAADEAVAVNDLIMGMKVYTAALLRLDRWDWSQS